MNIRRVLPALLLALPLAAAAQMDPTPTAPTNNPPMSSPTPGVVRQGGLAQDSGMNASGGTDAEAMRDRSFLRRASQGNQAEIRLSQLAAQQSASEDVKKLAQKMVNDHTALDDAMRPFAQRLGIIAPKAPNKMDKLEYDKLSLLTGDDFDREYLTAMSQDHHHDLHDFHDEASVTSDADLRDTVNRAVAMIERHTRMVDRLALAHGVPHP